MRVISGTIKGRKLKTLSGGTVRPTADRVKEALFSIIANRLPNAKVLDLFAGSGALGIEAISRGAQSAVFVENNPSVLDILHHNLEHCAISHKTKVVRWNIENSLECLSTYSCHFDLVFMDPPYRLGLVAKTIKGLLHSNCLAQHATIVAEHEPGIEINLADSPLLPSDVRRYGSSQLSFFEFAQ